MTRLSLKVREADGQWDFINSHLLQPPGGVGGRGWPPFPAPMGAAPGFGAAAAEPRASLIAPDVPRLSCQPWLSFRDLSQDQRQPATEYVPLGPQHLASLGRTPEDLRPHPGQHLAQEEPAPQSRVPRWSQKTASRTVGGSLGTPMWR